jgi:hypothetical protein
VQHVDAVFTSLGLLYAFCVSDYLPWLLGLDLDGQEKMVKEASKIVHGLHDKVIDERWRQWKSGERQEPEDFLDVLITLKGADGKVPLLTIEEVKAQSQVKPPSLEVQSIIPYTRVVFCHTTTRHTRNVHRNKIKYLLLMTIIAGHHVRGRGQPVERGGVGAGGDGERPGDDEEGSGGA